MGSQPNVYVNTNVEHYSLSPGTSLCVRLLLVLTAFDSGHIIDTLKALEVEILDFEHLCDP